MRTKYITLILLVVSVFCLSCASCNEVIDGHNDQIIAIDEDINVAKAKDGTNVDLETLCISAYENLPEVLISEISFDDIPYRTFEEYMAQDVTDDTPYECSWEMTEDVSDVPEENIILWAVPSMGETYEGYSQGEKAVNEQLRKDGYPFRIKIVTIPEDNYSLSAENCDADIIYTGDKYTGEPYQPSYKVVRGEKGKYLQLDCFLEGSKLWEHCPKTDWDSVEYKGAHYVVPNYALCSEVGMQIRIKKSCYTEKQLEGFDGTLDTLLPLISAEKKLFYGLGDFAWLAYEGIDYQGYGMYCDEEGNVRNVMDLDINIRWMRELNRMFREGIAFEDLSPEICEDKWAIALTGIADKNRFCEEEYYIYNFQGPSNSFYSGALAIRSTSENPEMAFKLLELVITDHTYANLMAYGGTGFVEKDGLMVDLDTGEALVGGGVRTYYFGLKDNMGRCFRDISSFDSSEERAAYVLKYIKKTDDRINDYPALIHLMSFIKNDYYRLISDTKNEDTFNRKLSEYIARSRQAFKILEEYQ